MSADVLLDRLDKVRKRGAGQWTARCPAHDDKGPSLSVRELPDERVLVHCFAGCDADAVLAAVGLDFEALFPPRPQPGHGAPALKRRRLMSAAQALELLHDEALIVAVVAADIGAGRNVSDSDRQRVMQAAARLAVLRDEVYS